MSPRNTDSQPEVSSIEPMTSFTLLTEHEVRKLIEAMPKKSCALDPMPTPLLVACIDTGLGARFGIPSLITMRPTVTSGYNRPVFRTLTDVPIDISQCSSLRTNLMKL